MRLSCGKMSVWCSGRSVGRCCPRQSLSLCCHCAVTVLSPCCPRHHAEPPRLGRTGDGRMGSMGWERAREHLSFPVHQRSHRLQRHTGLREQAAAPHRAIRGFANAEEEFPALLRARATEIPLSQGVWRHRPSRLSLALSCPAQGQLCVPGDLGGRSPPRGG